MILLIADFSTNIMKQVIQKFIYFNRRYNRYSKVEVNENFLEIK